MGRGDFGTGADLFFPPPVRPGISRYRQLARLTFKAMRLGLCATRCCSRSAQRPTWPELHLRSSKACAEPPKSYLRPSAFHSLVHHARVGALLDHANATSGYAYATSCARCPFFRWTQELHPCVHRAPALGRGCYERMTTRRWSLGLRTLPCDIHSPLTTHVRAQPLDRAGRRLHARARRHEGGQAGGVRLLYYRDQIRLAAYSRISRCTRYEKKCAWKGRRCACVRESCAQSCVQMGPPNPVDHVGAKDRGVPRFSPRQPTHSYPQPHVR